MYGTQYSTFLSVYPDEVDDDRRRRASFEENVDAGDEGVWDVGFEIALSEVRESETMTNCLVGGEAGGEVRMC